MHHDGRDYLTTAQVAKVLGVKTSTVYAYVSRGRLQSQRIDGVSGSVFPVDEVEKLLTEGRPRPPAGVVERIRTQLSYLHDDRLYYRGHDVGDLARDMSFEQVAALLWEQSWPDTPPGVVGDVPGRVDAALGPTARGLDRIRLIVDLLGADDARRHQLDPAAVADKAVTILEAIVGTEVVDDSHVGVDGFAARLRPLLSDEPLTPERVGMLNAALVLLADHDLSAGTVAARVAASARGSVYAVISAGLGAFDGPMHGGATTFAYRFLAQALDDPESVVGERLRMGDRIPGTGHVVYRQSDPRAVTLMEMLRDAGDGDPRVMRAVSSVMGALGSSTFVNSDFALAALALSYRMRPDAAETIFAVARMVGWTAHALEEYGEKRLRFRPEGVYTGVRPVGV